MSVSALGARSELESRARHPPPIPPKALAGSVIAPLRYGDGVGVGGTSAAGSPATPVAGAMAAGVTSGLAASAAALRLPEAYCCLLHQRDKGLAFISGT